MRSNIHRLRLRMVAEIHCDAWSPAPAAQQEGDRGGAWGIALQGFCDRTAHRCGSKLIQQFEKLRRLTASRFPLSEGQVEQRFALWHGLLQTSAGGGVEGLAFGLQHGVAMVGIEHLLLTV